MAIKSLFLSASAWLAGSLASIDNRDVDPATTSSAVPECQAVFLAPEAQTHIEQIIDATDVLMLGENHGRWEAPCILLEIVQLAARHKEVRVGIELPPSFNTFVDANNCGRRDVWHSTFSRYRPRDLRGNEATRAVGYATFQMFCEGQVRALEFIGGFTNDPGRSQEMRVSDYRHRAIQALNRQSTDGEVDPIVIVFVGTAWNYDTREAERTTSRSLCARARADGTQVHCLYIADGVTREDENGLGGRFVLQRPDRFDHRGRRYDSIIELSTKTPARMVPRDE